MNLTATQLVLKLATFLECKHHLAHHFSTHWLACRLVTDEEGYAKNRFWLTDRRGRKLSSHNADMLAERVGAPRVS